MTINGKPKSFVKYAKTMLKQSAEELAKALEIGAPDSVVLHFRDVISERFKDLYGNMTISDLQKIEAVEMATGKNPKNTFRNRAGTPIEYDGKEYMTWEVETSPDHYVTFADVRLEEALEANGELGNGLDDKIAYYAGLDDDVDEAIEQYND